MVGLLIIVWFTMVAVLGALVRPDDTLDSDNQIHPIKGKKPGFNCTFLLLRTNEHVEKTAFYQKMFFGGTRKEFIYIPISSFEFDGANINYTEFNNEHSSGGYFGAARLSENVADVVYAVHPNSKIEQDNDGNLTFYDMDNNKITRSIEELKTEIRDSYIVHRTFWLGTDQQGRDLMSRLMAGTIVSLSVGLISVIISLIIGVFLGAIAGYYRGWVDDIIMWVINVVWSIPTLLFVIAITLALGRGFSQVFIAVGLTMWVEVARIVRGQVMSIREKEFIEAGKALGFRSGRIIRKHVLPNVMGPVIVVSAANFASAILIEAGMSYLGIGVQPPTPSWGSMIADHKAYFTTDLAYLAVLPGLCTSILVLAFMLLGNGLRDALDTRSVDDIKG